MKLILDNLVYITENEIQIERLTKLGATIIEDEVVEEVKSEEKEVEEKTKKTTSRNSKK